MFITKGTFGTPVRENVGAGFEGPGNGDGGGCISPNGPSTTYTQHQHRAATHSRMDVRFRGVLASSGGPAAQTGRTGLRSVYSKSMGASVPRGEPKMVPPPIGLCLVLANIESRSAPWMNCGYCGRSPGCVSVAGSVVRDGDRSSLE